MKLFRVKASIDKKAMDYLVEGDNSHQVTEKVVRASGDSIVTFPSSPKEVKKADAQLNIWEA
jgi:hypothetical protein